MHEEEEEDGERSEVETIIWAAAPPRVELRRPAPPGKVLSENFLRGSLIYLQVFDINDRNLKYNLILAFYQFL